MKFKLYKNFFIVLGIDLLLLTASFYLAHLIRFDFDIPRQHSILLYRVLPFILVTKVIIFYFFDLYLGMWRYTSIADLFNIIKAASLSTLIIISFILLGARFEGFSRSIFIIDWCFTILFISGYRMFIRICLEHFGEDKPRHISIRKALNIFNRKRGGYKRLIIFGAGSCGEKIYREIRDNAQLKYNVVGFLDDDSAKVGKKIHGIPVLSALEGVKNVIKKVNADEALIAIPSTNSSRIRTIVADCKESGISFKAVPGMGELINGKVTINAIREVAYQDLLGREVIKLDEERIGKYIKGQYVLVSGAGGSIGSELCRQICRFRPEGIILYERAETPLFEIEMELVREFPYVKVIAVLGDIRDRTQLSKAFSNYRPHVVFHAAAYKHVPIMEIQPWKAVKNNILGTRNIIEISSQYSVERFVFVSTDKAVRPVNIMGATKRVSEVLVQGQNGLGISSTHFVIVRFGNVVGSVGSVVPLFKKQIERGGPVTDAILHDYSRVLPAYPSGWSHG